MDLKARLVLSIGMSISFWHCPLWCFSNPLQLSIWRLRQLKEQSQRKFHNSSSEHWVSFRDERPALTSVFLWVVWDTRQISSEISVLILNSINAEQKKRVVALVHVYITYPSQPLISLWGSWILLLVAEFQWKLLGFFEFSSFWL